MWFKSAEHVRHSIPNRREVSDTPFQPSNCIGWRHSRAVSPTRDLDHDIGERSESVVEKWHTIRLSEPRSHKDSQRLPHSSADSQTRPSNFLFDTGMRTTIRRQKHFGRCRLRCMHVAVLQPSALTVSAKLASSARIKVPLPNVTLLAPTLVSTRTQRRGTGSTP